MASMGAAIASAILCIHHNRNTVRYRLAADRFSLGAAQLPLDAETDTLWYPAYFSQWAVGDLHGMACAAILIMNSKMWYVHGSRIVIAEYPDETRPSIATPGPIISEIEDLDALD